MSTGKPGVRSVAAGVVDRALSGKRPVDRALAGAGAALAP